MSKEHLLHVPSIPPEGPDRVALIASMLVRLDDLASDVRALQRADTKHDRQIADLMLALEQLRIEITALRTAGDAQLRVIKMQLEEEAEHVGKIMRSQSAIQAENDAQTRLLGIIAPRLPSKLSLTVAGVVATAVVCGAVALFQRWPIDRAQTPTPSLEAKDHP